MFPLSVLVTYKSKPVVVILVAEQPLNIVPGTTVSGLRSTIGALVNALGKVTCVAVGVFALAEHVVAPICLDDVIVSIALLSVLPCLADSDLSASPEVRLSTTGRQVFVSVNFASAGISASIV